MQANFDARTAAAGTPAGPMERHQPEARQDRWMLELERAAMAGGAQGRAAPQVGPRGAASVADLRTPEAGAPARAAAADTPAGAHHGAGAARDAAALRSPYAGTPGAAPWHAPAGIAAALPAAGRSFAPAGAGPAPSAAPGTAAPLSGIPATGLQPTLALGAPTLPFAGAMLHADADADADAGAEMAAMDAPAPVPTPQDGEAYARSLLHVYRAEDGVHAWLRDASLSGAQVRRVAGAMAGELALAGTPLATLTVNGRRILSPGAAGDQPGRRAADQSGAADVPRPAPVASKGA